MTDYDFHHSHHTKVQTKSKKTLWVTLWLTVFFTLVEIFGGIFSHSLALLSDSAHMVSDVVALGLSMLALYFATRPPNATFTFGYLRFEIIASFLNGLALAIIAVWIFIEGIRRFIEPTVIDFKLMFIVASIGLIVNIVLTVVLSHSVKEEENLNLQSALWHFIGDLLSSVGVIISAIIIYFTGYHWVDPLISMFIGGIILIGGWRILKESFMVLMESVPERFDLNEIRKEMVSIEGVEDVHELHLWELSTGHYTLTTHVFIDRNVQRGSVILAVNELLKEKYGIEHATIQVELAELHPHGEYGEQFLRQRGEAES